MGDYFKPWRRRLGVMTLVMACVFMGGWMRSFSVGDQVGMTIGNSNHFLTSAKGCFRWTRYRHFVRFSNRTLFHINPTYFSQRPVQWNSSEKLAEEPIEYLTINWSWHWLSCGFEFGNGRLPGDTAMGVWAIPYWIGIPMTGLAAYLLILKPRKSAPNKISEPITEKLN